jgi:tRNA(Ile)-lysidine synthase
LFEQVERRVGRWVASGLGPAWVIAVSGGGDSVGLLQALHAMAPRVGLTLSVAHLDHGVRGEAARVDAAFVADLAGTLGLPFDLGRWEPTHAAHFEADARRARYAWLLDVARARGAKAIAVGHTADDQAETVLHRILRGTGLRGLAGIPATRALSDDVTLVRPLLTISRQQIRGYLKTLGQPFRDDATNTDTSRTRARIRHDLLPKLAAEYNRHVAEALVRLGRLAADSERAYAGRVHEAYKLAVDLDTDHDGVTFRRDRLMTLPSFLRTEVLRLAWRRAGWPEVSMTERRWRRLVQLVLRTRSARTDVGEGIVAETWSSVREDSLLRQDTSFLHFTLRKSEAPVGPTWEPVFPESVALTVPGSTAWLDGRLILTLDPDAPRDETIDLDRVASPLCVRAPQPGDRFGPLGMEGRMKPLNDFFRGRKLGREQRARTPLLCDGVGIVWVVGHQISHRVRLTDSTIRRAGLRWESG